MLTILIAADHKPFREALTRLLLAQPLFRIMGVCADTHAAIAVATAEQPDIVLIDGSSDPLAAIEATKKIVSSSSSNVIALSRDLDAGFARHMMAAGALGYLTKQSPAKEVINAVEEVAKDNLFLCNDLCLDHQQLPVATPTVKTDAEINGGFKKSNPASRHNTRGKIADSIVTHWHGILRFTN